MRTGSKTLRVNNSFRCGGVFAGCFTTIQASIWILMMVLGIFCFFNKCGDNRLAEGFGEVYMDLHSNSPSCLVKPIVFLIIMVFYLIFSILWLFASVNILIEFRVWNYLKGLRGSAVFWSTITSIVCIADLLFLFLLLADFACMHFTNRAMDDNLPIIILFGIAIKGLVIWTINIILICFIVVKMKSIKYMGASFMDHMLVCLEERRNRCKGAGPKCLVGGKK